MLDAAYLADVKARHEKHALLRRELNAACAVAQNEAKRAIFALHRDDVAGADALLASSAKHIAEVRARIVGVEGLDDAGPLRAALEEFGEATLYRAWTKDRSIGPIAMEGMDHALYLGALSDLAGELQRRQVRLATDGKLDEVRAVKDDIESIVTALLGMDLEGSLRTKFDQTKNALRRAEDVLYDLSLRRG